MKSIKKKAVLAVILILCMAMIAGYAVAEELDLEGRIVVACVGDSITKEVGAEDAATDSYPALLQNMLGDAYAVVNCGNSGACVQADGDNPYRERKPYETSLAIDAQIYLIMLGTNDCKAINWNAEGYEQALGELINGYREHTPDAKFYLMTPPHTYVTEDIPNAILEIGEDHIMEARLIVLRVAEEKGVNVIDINAFTENHADWFSDGIHPNNDGHAEIAQFVFDSMQEDPEA